MSEERKFSPDCKFGWTAANGQHVTPEDLHQFPGGALALLVHMDGSQESGVMMLQPDGECKLSPEWTLTDSEGIPPEFDWSQAAHEFQYLYPAATLPGGKVRWELSEKMPIAEDDGCFDSNIDGIVITASVFSSFKPGNLPINCGRCYSRREDMNRSRTKQSHLWLDVVSGKRIDAYAREIFGDSFPRKVGEYDESYRQRIKLEKNRRGIRLV